MNKKIVTLQEDIKDCGAACLSSIIKFYGGYVPMEKIRLDCCISKDGITAYHLINAAKVYGFCAYGTKLDCQNELKISVLPVIAHMVYKNGLQHFIVIYKVNKRNILVMDPACGLKKLELSEFKNNFSGVIINLYPLSNILKMKRLSLTNLFFNYLKYEKKLIIQVTTISTLLTIFVCLSSFFTKVVMDSLSTNPINTSLFLVITFFGIYLIKILVTYLKSYYLNYLNKNLDVRIITPFISHLIKLPLNSIATKSPGEIAKRVTELENLKSLFTDILLSIITDFSLFILSTIILFNLSRTLFFILLIIALLLIIISLIFNKTNLSQIMQNINKETNFQSIVVAIASKIESIKNIHNYSYFDNLIEETSCDYIGDSFKLNSFLNFQNLLKDFSYEIGLFFLNCTGFYLIYQDKLSFLNLITFNSVCIYFLDPIRNLLGLIIKYNYLKSSFNKISEFITLNEEPLYTKQEDFTNGDIKINNLSYSYNGIISPLNNINLTIKEGSKVMLKGPSGCGKSTLCKIIYRLYKASFGTILINDINIYDYNLNTIRNNITYLSQEEKLFNTSLKENIILNQEIPIDKLEDILRICCLKEFVDKQPLRLATPILEDASNLSGGEKQRIILARSLLKNSKIIILDEALSEVPVETETKIINNIKNYYPDKTLIYVSHKNLDNLFDYTIDMERLC